MKKLAAIFLNVIFPPKCLACARKHNGKTGLLICEDCFKKIEINGSLCCPKCGKRIYDYRKTCGHAPQFVLAAATSYKDLAVRELIHALKYKKLETAAEPLAAIMAQYFVKIFRNLDLSARRNLGAGGDIRNFLLIPIPLHPKKERARGFNQNLLVLKKLSEIIPLPEIEKNALGKIRNTDSQIGLADYNKRTLNISGSFGILNKEKIAGKNILLFDDVYTSGATLKEAVRVLKENGARKIIGLVIAKA